VVQFSCTQLVLILLSHPGAPFSPPTGLAKIATKRKMMTNQNNDTDDQNVIANSQKYRIEFHNKSGVRFDFLCYQDTRSDASGSFFPLAWFVKSVENNAKARLEWSEDYHFALAETGELKPGIKFDAIQTLSGDPNGANEVNLTRAGDKLILTNDATNGPKGTLTIRSTSLVPVNVAALGIGMAGQGTLAWQAALPGHSTQITVSAIKYWISFGKFEVGQVLDTKNILNPYEVTFPANIFVVYATLLDDFTWNVTTSID